MDTDKKVPLFGVFVFHDLVCPFITNRNEVINMSNIIFTESQRKKLESHPNVIKVSDRSITYSPDFKIIAVEENAKRERTH